MRYRSLKLNLANQTFLLLLLILRLRCLEFRHHLFGKELQAFANLFMTVFTRLVQQDDLVDMQCRILAQVVADRLRRAKQTARDGPRVTFRILRLPFLVFGTKVVCPGRWSVAVFAEPTREIVFNVNWENGIPSARRRASSFVSAHMKYLTKAIFGLVLY